ncbi:hypothetical protein Gpo141_00014357, partial [Globisporangium polare]
MSLFNETEIADFFNKSSAILDSVNGNNNNNNDSITDTPEPATTVPTWFTTAPPKSSLTPTGKATTTPTSAAADASGSDDSAFTSAYNKALQEAKNALAYSSSSGLSTQAIIGIVVGS